MNIFHIILQEDKSFLLECVSCKCKLSNDQLYSNFKLNRKYILEFYFCEGLVVSRIWNENNGKVW